MGWIMDIQLKIVPYTAGQYFVSEKSEVFDQHKNQIPETIIDGKKFVKLKWYSGEKEYELGLVVLSAFEKIGHDCSRYDRVKVIYKDGNSSNVFLSNLTYVFSGDPIESHIPGFYLIPGFSRYLISRSGEVLDSLTNKLVRWRASKPAKGNRLGGYMNGFMQSDVQNANVAQHRVLALTFIPFTGIYNKLTVNHRDGVKSNNSLDNLEWCTYAENNKHAWDSGLKLNNRPKILKKNLLTGKIDSYRSVRECAYSLGDVSGFYVAARIQDQSGKIYPDYLLFKRDDDTDWPEVDYSKIPKVPNSYSNALVARNVFTGKTIIFDDVEEFSKEFNVPATIILDHARNNQFKPANGYNFKYLINAHTWPQHTERHLLVYKDYPIDPPDGVVMIDTESGEETFFTSYKKAVEKMGIHPGHLRTLLHDKRLFKKRYAFKLFKLKDNLL